MSTDDTIVAAIDAALDAGHFFLATGRLRIMRSLGEATSWELFRGHLLAEDQTRQVEPFDAWHLYFDEPDAAASVPLISLLWDRRQHRVHVIRRILSHTFEAYEQSPGVILSRPAQKWLREWVGSVDLRRTSPDRLLSHLQDGLFAAVTGTSRLPIASHESPLPAFSLGRVAYLPDLPCSSTEHGDPLELLRTALDGRVPVLQQAKTVETALRAGPDETVPEIAQALAAFATRPGNAERLQMIWKALFNHVALSPYTGFVDRWVATLSRCADEPTIGGEATLDTIGWMLRHLCRHLTAFDLTTFHNYGANYPDALFLDALLKEYIRLLAANPRAWRDKPNDSDQRRRIARIRRRALRQACIVWRHYQGHRVPDAPTSQGENLRVMPPPLARVPEDQILNAGARRRLLFDGEPLAHLLGDVGSEALRVAVADLATPAELRELGMACFLDRPLGAGKAPGTVDRTPLVSYVAFSRAIAAQRIAALAGAGDMEPEARSPHEAALEELSVGGVSVESLTLVERPGVVSLADAVRASPDFVVLRTTKHSLDEVLSRYRWPAALEKGDVALLVGCGPGDEPSTPSTLRVYDPRGQIRYALELPSAHDANASDVDPNFVELGCVEWPRQMRFVHVERSGEEAAETASPKAADATHWLTFTEDDVVADSNSNG